MKRDDVKMSEFSRRRFLQGAAGGAAAGSALTTLPGLAEESAAAATRHGVRRYAAEGVATVLNVNGAEKAVKLTPHTTLLHALRESLELTGAKEVCDRGACGACTVLIDGRSVNSCMMLALDAVGRDVTTVEGLMNGDDLDGVQQAFVEHDACQCGYCIPGFVVRSRALLDEHKGRQLDRESIKHGLCGNICRCAAYTRILDAVEAAAKGGRS
jgi:aerobic-type carbon monoxide dehydrogenase small subunit (CoxS/CutS family)